MLYSVDLTLDKNVADKFYCAFDSNGHCILDLCEKHINKLWPKTKEASHITVKVSEKRHKGSRKIKIRVGKFEILFWSVRGMEEESIDSFAGDWILDRFQSMEDHKHHSIYVSATPTPD